MQETGGDVGAGSPAGGAESRDRRGVGGGRGGPRSAGAASAADHGAPGVAPAQHSSGLGGDPWSPAQRPGRRPCVLYPTRRAVQIGLGAACGGRWDKRTGGSGAAEGWNGQGAWGGQRIES